jgi:hypothetical protein
MVDIESSFRDRQSANARRSIARPLASEHQPILRVLDWASGGLRTCRNGQVGASPHLAPGTLRSPMARQEREDACRACMRRTRLIEPVDFGASASGTSA